MAQVSRDELKEAFKGLRQFLTPLIKNHKGEGFINAALNLVGENIREGTVSARSATEILIRDVNEHFPQNKEVRNEMLKFVNSVENHYNVAVDTSLIENPCVAILRRLAFNTQQQMSAPTQGFKSCFAKF